MQDELMSQDRFSRGMSQEPRETQNQGNTSRVFLGQDQWVQCSRIYRKGVDRTKQSRHTLPSSKLEPTPSFYHTTADDPLTLSTFPNTRSFEAQDIDRDVYCFEEKDPGPDDHSTTAVGGPRGYDNRHWPVDPSLAVSDTPYFYHGLSDPREELCGLSTTQAPHSRSSQQQMTQEEENFIDDNSMFFMEGMPEMN